MAQHIRRLLVSFASLIAWAGSVQADVGRGQPQPENLIPNGDFRNGPIGDLPEGWTLKTARPVLAPKFKLVAKDGRRLLHCAGNGNPDCVGYVQADVPIMLGKTYEYRVLFKVSRGFNPHEHLLFRCYGPGANDGIFDFQRLKNDWVEGKAKICYPGDGKAKAAAQILFRLSADGEAWIREITLTETEPVKPRWVTVACTQGRTNLESCQAVLDATGKTGVDLVLLPEYMQGALLPEPVPGPSSELMSAKAKQYKMYVAGGIVRQVSRTDRLYNTALLYDRRGKLVGAYDKVHPYSPEVNDQGITPGTQVPVFAADFGKVGFMICYDSWFPDVVELLSLKGAELILFPNAGYYRALMPARAADNRVRIVSSSWNRACGVWDTIGRDVLDPDACVTAKRPGIVTFKDVVQSEAAGIGILTVTLDLNVSHSPAYNGGTMYSAPGGRRNRRDQVFFLEDEIKKERRRWWVD